MDSFVHQLHDVLSRIRANRLDFGSSRAHHDSFLALLLDVDRLIDPDSTVAEVFPHSRLDIRLVWNLLAAPQEDLLPRDLGHHEPQRQIRHIILLKQPRTFRHRFRKRRLHLLHAGPLRRGNHEHAVHHRGVPANRRARRLHHLIQHIRRNLVGLVEHQYHRRPRRRLRDRRRYRHLHFFVFIRIGLALVLVLAHNAHLLLLLF
mmetsp:Transcript_3635/g.9255  ORF Transcript_3635/g.9255 Transcript_3635/m.9255 type:complete len:204 (+) Transcript_3635:646-1257(+)